jgi:hypothetical protein
MTAARTAVAFVLFVSALALLVAALVARPRGR